MKVLVRSFNALAKLPVLAGAVAGQLERGVTRSVKLLNEVRERVRYLHYSLQTGKAYVY